MCIRDSYGDSLHFPIHDRQGDFISGASRSPYDFSPSNIKDSVVYDAINRRYILYEKIGERYYRIPATYSFDEYWQMRNRQAEVEYFKRRANTTSLLNRNRFTRPKLSLTDNLFNRLFGNGKIDISPQGNVDLTAGYQGQRIDNPTPVSYTHLDVYKRQVYALQALEQHGAASGSYLTIHRLVRCGPWCKSGHDPVPPQAPRLFSALFSPTSSKKTP